MSASLAIRASRQRLRKKAVNLGMVRNRQSTIRASITTKADNEDDLTFWFPSRTHQSICTRTLPSAHRRPIIGACMRSDWRCLAADAQAMRFWRYAVSKSFVLGFLSSQILLTNSKQRLCGSCMQGVAWYRNEPPGCKPQVLDVPGLVLMTLYAEDLV